MSADPIWRKIEDEPGDAFEIDMTFHHQTLCLRRIPMTWKERLLSWPWRPWVGVRLEMPEEEP